MNKIMIVEDSSLMIAVIKNFINKEGKDVEIIEAHSGEEAVSKYSSEKPNLVFMDIKMPGMDGITALETIRNSDSKAKIVMCTSLKEPEQEERAKKAGAVGYIMKPFSRQDIIEAINKNLSW
jgi:two-component system chemotaxis response regulator CheY